MRTTMSGRIDGLYGYMQCVNDPIHLEHELTVHALEQAHFVMKSGVIYKRP